MKKFKDPLESSTRIKINNWLYNLGWNIDESNVDCNCFTERARTEEENKKLNGNRPDYVLYSTDKKPIAIIETKRQGVILENKLTETINKYATPLDIKIVFITDGIFILAYHTVDNDYLYYNSEIVTEFLTEKQLKLFISNGSKLFSEKKIVHTKVELIKIFQEANDILRMDGLSEGKERFTEFSNLLFLKLISDIEKQNEEKGHKRRLKEIYCWDFYCNKNELELQTYINNIVLPEFYSKYNGAGDIFNKELLIKKPSNLKEIVNKISNIGNLLDTNSDIKGDAFEYFLKNSISVGNDLGEYFTPRHIVKLMVELIDLKFEETIYDPCCGTGGFLIEAFKNIKNKCKNTEENLKKLENKTVFGRELTTTSKIAKMNMIIIGDGHNNIEQIDSLEHPIKELYDVVLTNYAFSQKTNYGNLYGFNTTNANIVFIKHIYDSLTKDGRCAMVLPEGVLFENDNEHLRIRKLLIDEANVEAIIRLHSYVFKPYTGQPTSIIVLNKGEKTKKVWFFDVEEDGFKKSNSIKGRRKIEFDDLILLRQIWKDKKETEKSFFVDVNEIRNNSYKLSMNNYDKKKKSLTTKKLRELVEEKNIIIGFTPPRENDSFWFGGKNIWVSISDIGENMYISDSKEKINDIAINPNKLLPSGTLLFSFKLTIGKVAITTKPLYTNEAIAGLIIEDEILKKYLYFILPKLDYNSNRATKGATLNSETIKNLEIPYDEKKIQEIVKELDEIENQIQNTINIKYKFEYKKNSLIFNLFSF